MRAIVTGANGFVGSSLIKKLIAHQIEVLAIDVSFEPSKLPDHPLITTAVTDLTDTEQFNHLIKAKEYELFYHFAWRGVNGPDKAKYDVQLDNIRLSLQCAESAKRAGCRKFLCAGTVAERSVESLSFLQRTSGGMMYGSAKHCDHIMLETYCKNIGLDFVWMQFSNIYGPDNKTGNLISYTLGQLTGQKEAAFGPARQPYDFIYIDDLIEAVYRLGVKQTGRHYYFIGSGTPMILSDYLLKIGKMLGREDLIKIGARGDDGVRYTFEMLDTSDLVKDIGEYVSGTFDERIQYTIDHY